MKKLTMYKPTASLVVMMLMVLWQLAAVHAQTYDLPITGTDAVRCGAGELTLTVTWSGDELNPDNVKWYDVPFYGTPIGTGLTLNTGYIEFTRAYYVDYIGEDGCSECDRLLIRAVIADQVITPQVTYQSLVFCNITNHWFLPTIVGANSGTFSVSSGLTEANFNTTTGAFNPTGLTAGAYVVTFTPEEIEGCDSDPVSVTLNVTNAPVPPTISYPLESYCSSHDPVEVNRTGATGGTYSASPSGLIINSSNGEITPATSQTGEYTVTYLVSGGGGCPPVSATTIVSILRLPTASISYAGPFTQNQEGPQAVSLTGTDDYMGGTFSATPAGLGLNASTGEIDPSESNAGQYTVTYTKANVSPCTGDLIATTTVTIFALPSAEIAVTGEPVCLGGDDPIVTFTGSAGAEPYTFVYIINDGGTQDISTADAESTVTLEHPTLIAGTYTYKILSVTDGNNSTRTYDEGSEPEITITVTTPKVATFQYESSAYCDNATNPTPTFLDGGEAGIFSSSAGLVFTDANTGEINLAESTPGTYIITNTHEATGGCGIITHDFEITITELPVATFSYAESAYCVTDDNPSATIPEGTTVGVFSSIPGGVVFVTDDDPAPGTINLSASSPGTYTIVHTIAETGGCGEVTDGFEIIINPAPDPVTLAYSFSPFCNNDPAIQPAEITGPDGGAFSYVGPEGKTLNLNTTTGDITPNGSDAGLFTVTYTFGADSGCEPSTDTYVVEILEAPTVTNDPTLSVCSGSSTNIELTSTLSSTFSWEVGDASANILGAIDGEGDVIDQFLSNSSDTESGTVEYIITPTSTDNGCVGNTFTLTVTVSPAINLLVTTPDEVCYPSTIDLTHADVTAGSTAGLTLTYWNDEDLTNEVTNPEEIALSGTYYIIAEKGGCFVSQRVTLTVNPIPSNPTATNVTVVYDGQEHTGTATTTSAGAVIDWYTEDSGTVTTTAPSGTAVGTYEAYAESRYPNTGCISESRTKVTVEITAATLTITVQDVVIGYGEEVPSTYTVTYEGFVGTETPTVLSGSLSFTQEPEGTATGTYTIKASGLSGTNYNIVYVDGTLEIAPVIVDGKAYFSLHDAFSAIESGEHDGEVNVYVYADTNETNATLDMNASNLSATTVSIIAVNNVEISGGIVIEGTSSP